MSDEKLPPCPIPNCEGMVRVISAGELRGIGCDGKGQHGDASIHNAWQSEMDGDEAQNAFAMSEIERRLDPVDWAIECLKRARVPAEKHFHRVDTKSIDRIEQFPTGFTNTSEILPSLGGMVTLSGKASAGKSWFALGVGLSAGEEGWDVHYVAAEGIQTIKERLQFAARPEVNFELHSISPGFTLNETLDEIQSWIKMPKTLLIFDSISTMQALMASSNAKDKWETQSKLEMFLMQVRSLTRGYVAIMNLSESNAAGETKGRSLDHRSDIAINFASTEADHEVKTVVVVKNWNGRSGPLGYGRVDSRGPGLEISDVAPGESAPEPEPDPHHPQPQGPIVGESGVLEPPRMQNEEGEACSE